VRRGSTNANIFALSFDNQEIPEYLSCSSDKDTIHIFVVEIPERSTKDRKNVTGNMFQKMIGNSESRSYAQLALKDKNQNPKCGFSDDSQTLIVVTQSGLYMEAKIDKQGPLKITNQHDLLNNQRQVN